MNVIAKRSYNLSTKSGDSSVNNSFKGMPNKGIMINSTFEQGLFSFCWIALSRSKYLLLKLFEQYANQHASLNSGGNINIR